MKKEEIKKIDMLRANRLVKLVELYLQEVDFLITVKKLKKLFNLTDKELERTLWELRHQAKIIISKGKIIYSYTSYELHKTMTKSVRVL